MPHRQAGNSRCPTRWTGSDNFAEEYLKDIRGVPIEGSNLPINKCREVFFRNDTVATITKNTLQLADSLAHFFRQIEGRNLLPNATPGTRLRIDSHHVTTGANK